MPNRILREGILTSARVNELSERAELFYRRLMSRLDDHGRCEAHAELLRTACYPLRVDRVRRSHIEEWLLECVKAKLLLLYEVAGKRYLQALDWRQQVRAPSKCPAPDGHLLSDAAHPIANEHLGGGGGEGGVVVEGVGVIPASSAPALSAGVNGNAVAYIPLNDGSEFGVSQELAAELVRLYPAVNVTQTLNEIRGWNLANPQRRKTRKGVLQHINSWMTKEQNRGPQ